MREKIKQAIKQANSKDLITITLSSWKKRFDFATASMELWLSEEIVKKNPKYILFFEQNEEEYEEGKRYFDGSDNYHGRRYTCEASNVLKYLKFFSPGYHQLMVVVIAGEEESAREVVEMCLKKYANDRYNWHLKWKFAENNTLGLNCLRHNDCFIYSIIKKLEVPKELFAEKSETKISKAVQKFRGIIRRLKRKSVIHAQDSY